MSAEKQRDPAEDTTGRPAASEEPPKQPDAPKPGLDYVFKISPADPKSSFDFEDVADK